MVWVAQLASAMRWTAVIIFSDSPPCVGSENVVYQVVAGLVCNGMAFPCVGSGGLGCLMSHGAATNQSLKSFVSLSSMVS